MSCGVYQIKNKENGLIYIGSSRNIKKRWYAHKYKLRKNKHCNMFLQNDWNIYGEDVFEFTILEECVEDNQYDLEQEYINNYLPFHRNDKGYNINESSKRGNIDSMKIFRNKYRVRNKFYKCSKKRIKELLLEDIEDGELYSYPNMDVNKLAESMDTKSKNVWDYVREGTCMIEPTFGRARSVSNEIVDSMTRDELDSYCDALDTYEEFLEMAREGYIGDWE